MATTRQRTVFELANAVGEGARPRALTALASLVGARESGVRIVAMLARHARQLWVTQELLARTDDKFEVAQALGIPPFFVDDMIKQARRLDRARLSRMHAALFAADKDLKSARREDARILEALVLELTRAEPARPRRA